MRLITIEEVNKFDDGEIIPSMRGTITNVYPRKTGSNDKGDWSVQNAIFKDATGEIRLSIWGHDDLKSLSGQEVSIEAYKSDKGLSGIYAEDDTYKGVTKRQIKVTATGNIRTGKAQAESEQEVSEGSTVRDVHKNDPTGRANQVAAQARDAMLIALEKAYQVKAAWNLEHKDDQMNGEHFKTISASIYITMQQAHVISAMPVNEEKEW